MILSSIEYRRRLVGGGSAWILTAALVVLGAAAPAWGQPNEVTKLLASDGATNDQFGFAVSINGDTVIVGAPLDSHPERKRRGKGDRLLY